MSRTVVRGTVRHRSAGAADAAGVVVVSAAVVAGRAVEEASSPAPPHPAAPTRARIITAAHRCRIG
jgi:hypothetical protein